MNINKILALLIVLVALGLIQEVVVSFFGINFPNMISRALLGLVFIFAGMSINQIFKTK